MWLLASLAASITDNVIPTAVHSAPQTLNFAQDSEEWEGWIKAAFDAFDVDGSGRLDTDRLNAVLCGDVCEVISYSHPQRFLSGRPVRLTLAVKKISMLRARFYVWKPLQWESCRI